MNNESVFKRLIQKKVKIIQKCKTKHDTSMLFWSTSLEKFLTILSLLQSKLEPELKCFLRFRPETVLEIHSDTDVISMWFFWLWNFNFDFVVDCSRKIGQEPSVSETTYMTITILCAKK